MAEKIVKGKITFPIFVNGVPKAVGETFELPESEMNHLCNMERATKDMSWSPAKKKETAQAK